MLDQQFTLKVTLAMGWLQLSPSCDGNQHTHDCHHLYILQSVISSQWEVMS